MINDGKVNDESIAMNEDETVVWDICRALAMNWSESEITSIRRSYFPPDPSCSRALISKLDKIFFKKLGERLSDVFEKIADV